MLKREQILQLGRKKAYMQLGHKWAVGRIFLNQIPFYQWRKTYLAISNQFRNR